MILKGYLFSVLYALACLGLAFGIYKLGAPKKITRKIVHILVGFEWLILYVFMGPGVHFLAVCLIFTAVLAVSYRKSLMPMISSDGDNAPGTVYYAIAMSIMAVIMLFEPSMIHPFGIGVFCTSFGDGLAGLVGQSLSPEHNPKIYGNKSLAGTLTNFAVCFAVALFFSHYFEMGLNLWHCLAIAVFGTQLELFIGRGLDNILITLGTSLLSYSLINFESTLNYIVTILLTPAIIAFAYKKKALTVGGILSALLLDIAVSVSLGNFGFVILFAFFALGIVSDKIKKRYKNSRQKTTKPSECRNSIQVLSNGFACAACALAYLFTSNHAFLIGFVASLAEALADTMASGIGVISGKAFDPFRMKPCKPGISGGMSLLGTTFSLIGASIIALLALAFGRISSADMIIVIFAGVLGGIFDSFLGSLVQVKYRCNLCGEITEKRTHCDTPTTRSSGLRLVNNDTVNFLSTVFAAAISILGYTLF